MVEDPATRVAGLRGLYIEAERENEGEAARQIAERARAEAPAVGWAARALMRHQTAAADWDAALATLSGAADARILDKRTARRQRAVILTAKALAKEDGEPDVARAAAQEAHDLAADLVPAAVVAGRLFARQGDIRRATRILEATWRTNPHPEIADAYTHVRPGDSALDRLKRAETLFRLRPHADEGRHAVARAAIDARDFSRAREVLAPVLTERPTQRALMLMAELEEAETGDRGRAREWQARAVYAPRDPVWTADGKVLEEWAPVSPSGRIDAVEWKVPIAEIEGPRIEIATTDVMTVPVVSGAPDSPPPPVATVAPAISSAPAIPPPPASPPPEVAPVSLPSWLAAPAEAHPFAVRPATPQPPPRHSPPPVALVPRSEKARPAPLPSAEPPRPDDPGVVDDERCARRAAHQRALTDLAAIARRPGWIVVLALQAAEVWSRNRPSLLELAGARGAE